jgi:hypothetical protein
VHVPFLLVMAVVAIGVLRIVQYHWRQGAVLVGVALLLAAVLRAVLRDERLGLVAVRGRAIDVMTYAAFGTMIIAVAVTIEGFLFG